MTIGRSFTFDPTATDGVTARNTTDIIFVVPQPSRLACTIYAGHSQVEKNKL